MNTNRILGIFIGVTLLTWLLIFGLSPQPKYKKNNSINIPKLPESLINLGDSKKIEFKEVKDDSFEIDIEDEIISGSSCTHQGKITHKPTQEAVNKD